MAGDPKKGSDEGVWNRNPSCRYIGQVKIGKISGPDFFSLFTFILETEQLKETKLVGNFQVNMVLLETLRLDCPVITLFRKASKDMELGNLKIPKDTEITIPVVKIHRMKKYWGEDANEFNPLRFNNGISNAAKHPNALMAFGVGPRACIGQNFAMLEPKMVLALLLQRFSLSLSPEYRHMPADNLTLQPQDGIPILVQPLCL